MFLLLHGRIKLQHFQLEVVSIVPFHRPALRILGEAATTNGLPILKRLCYH